ncbi:MAG: glycosyltransferase [Desulfobacterales bacterium]|nr:glycosyltransferase [Desulfobacterales bacterium]
MVWNYLAAIGAFIWLAIILLPWRPWGTREYMDSPAATPDADLSDITVLIPARNEAEVISTTLSSLKTQGHDLPIVMVDDRSTDGTVMVAQTSGMKNLRILSGEPLPADWSGKLWALEQGFRHVNTPLVLLIDGDIELQPGIVQGLRRKLKENHLHLVSLMAQMRMVSFWERLLMPAFVYFFKMLYPFRLSNSAFRGVAAAAGGCILLEARLIREIGGFKAICHELIDDCALAKRVKSLGYRTWIGLTHSVHSLRSYGNLEGIWNMVARTAFFQLRYSAVLLAGTTAIMLTVFWLPVAGLFFPTASAKIISACALAALILSYLPTLKFYGQSRGWAVALPLIAALYLAMTWSSAIRFWVGAGSPWKGRFYSRHKKL